MTVKFGGSYNAYLFPHVPEHYTRELSPHLPRCMGSMHSEVNSGCQEHVSQQREWGLPSPGSSLWPLLGQGVSSTLLYI